MYVRVESSLMEGWRDEQSEHDAEQVQVMSDCEECCSFYAPTRQSPVKMRVFFFSFFFSLFSIRAGMDSDHVLFPSPLASTLTFLARDS